MSFLHAWAGAALLAAGGMALGQGPAFKTIRMISIPGRPLPAIVAEMRGTFAKYGINVESAVAPSSDALRAAPGSEKADIAQAAVDNAVAMDQGAENSVVIVLGGESSLNELIAQPGIGSIAELRGRTLIVDAPNTAFPLQLKKILLSKGLEAGRDYRIKAIGTTPKRLQAMREHKQYAATMLGPPWPLLANRDGFVSLGATRTFIGPYQSLGAFVPGRGPATMPARWNGILRRTWRPGAGCSPRPTRRGSSLFSKGSGGCRHGRQRRPTRCSRREIMNGTSGMQLLTFMAFKTCSSCALESNPTGPGIRLRRGNATISHTTMGPWPG